VRSFAGVQVWNDYDAAAKRWHLVVRDKGKLTTPSIPVSREPIEADVGPGPGGGPMLAYVACAGACRVVVSAVDGGSPRTVAGSDRASAPTIHGRQVAWVRGAATVMTSTLSGSGRRTLAGVPRRKCFRESDDGPRRCARPSNAFVGDLELNGTQLALLIDFDLNVNAGVVSEVRTESIKGGPQRLVALLTSGEGGQSWLGPSWAKGKLYFYKTCVADPSACQQGAGVFRFDPARMTYQRAGSATPLAGFAIDGDGRRAYETRGPADDLECGSDGAGPCDVRLTDRLVFKPSRSQVRDPS
jgi:hypothetical protein